MLRVKNQIEPNEYNNFSIHFARYKFAHTILRHSHKTILDYGCGTGYGSRFLQSSGFNVTGIDYNEADLRKDWNDNLNVNFNFFNKELESPKKYDSVISFEVIEHIPINSLEEYFYNIKNKLNKYGTHLNSTPRFLPIQERSENRQKYHVQEFTFNQYSEILLNHFRFVTILSQNDTTISSQSENMAWNYFAICRDPK